jgi:predicted transcriptional regulator
MMYHMPTPILTLRLPDDEARALSEIATARGITRSDLIRELLRSALDPEQTPTPGTSAA